MTDMMRALPVPALGFPPVRAETGHEQQGPRAAGRLRLAGAAALFMGLSAAIAPPAAAQALGDSEMRVLLLEQPFPYQAKDVALTEMLHEMSQKTGLPVVVGDGVSGRAAMDNVGGTVRSLLDGLAQDGRVSWWFDGAAVHVEGPQMVSRLLPLNGVRVADLDQALRAVGLTGAEYPILAEPGARMARIVAPPGYIDAVEQTIAALAAEAAPKAPAALPIIIRGPGRAAQRNRRLAPAQPVPYGYGAPAGAAPAYPAPAYPVPADPAGAAPYPTDPRKESR